MSIQRTTAAALCLLLAFTLAACSFGLSSNQPRDQVFVLRPPPVEGAAGNPGSADLMVLRPQMASGLDSNAIALTQPGQRLSYYTGDQWVGDAADILQSLTVQVLRASGKYSSVESDGTPFASTHLLRIEVRHFEAVYSAEEAPTVYVEFTCTLGERSDRRILKTFNVDSHVRAEANRMQAVVAAFQQATDAALTQLVTQASL